MKKRTQNYYFIRFEFGIFRFIVSFLFSKKSTRSVLFCISSSYFSFKLKGYFLYFTPIVHSMLKLRIHFRLVLIVYTKCIDSSPYTHVAQIRKETVQLLYMKRLIYLKNGQSLDLLVSPLKNDRP
jgi:hypothetical protein